MEKEIRKISGSVNNSDSRLVDGYASVFNSLSEDLGGFKEKIDIKAFDNVIEKSDVFALLNHDSKRGILARSKFGKGTLNLTIDEKGLKYSFEAPHTALGDEAIEMIKRGDIDSSSFAFTVESDKWEKQSDGTYIRTILKFNELFDISPVLTPAYQATSVECKRFLEVKEADEAFERAKQEIENQEDNKESIEIQEPEIENQEETEAVENQEENIEQENPVTETETEVVEAVENESESIDNEVIETEDKEEENKKRSIENNAEIEIRNNKINNKKMEEFRLISVIAKKAGVDKRELNEVEQDVLTRSSMSFGKTGLQKTTIQLPISEQRDITATGAGAGIENVSETKLNILEPLRANLALVSAGAQVLSGLVGDVSIPTYAGSSVAWKGETVAASDGQGAWGEVILKPKKMTAEIKISNQFLIQDSNDADAMLQRDIMNAVSEKLEQTILGNIAKSDNNPAGLFNGLTGSTGATYAVVTKLESDLENANVKNYSFIVNPKAKFALKNVKINEGKMVFDGNSIDGIATYSTSAVYDKGIVCADFRDLVIGVWGIDLTVDPYTLAGNGETRIIVNAYVDAAFRRPSFAVANIA